jgi:hypothetical protein
MKQPTTNNQQPTTNNQQPTTNNQQPTNPQSSNAKINEKHKTTTKLHPPLTFHPKEHQAYF